MSDILIIVVSYNNHKYTRAAVKSLQNQSIQTDFVVWDNASEDGTHTWLKKTNDFEYYISDSNLLWTPAINQAVNRYLKPHHKYIGYMNNDAAPDPDCIEKMLTWFSDSPNIGLMAPVMSKVGGEQDAAFCPKDRPHALKRVAFVLGAFAIVPRFIWETVGTLDDGMPLGADDHDYAIRVKDAGYKIQVALDAYANHKGHASGKHKEIWNKYGDLSWNKFNQKWAGYFHTTLEAKLCQWSSFYFPSWDVGTGWMSSEDRASIRIERQHAHKQNLKKDKYREIFEQEAAEGATI